MLFMSKAPSPSKKTCGKVRDGGRARLRTDLHSAEPARRRTHRAPPPTAPQRQSARPHPVVMREARKASGPFRPRERWY